ncbi:MAG: hypothetical protein WED00_09260 [Aquisalimonadaceae bacterium]
MREYDFTLKYRLGNPNEDAERYLEALAESGCEDAVVGVGQNGRISLNFIREAESALEAISSAISDVQEAIPEAKLVEASPDYVGVTDIAELFGFSRQYMRKFIQIKGASFPEPVHEGKPSLWHLTDILAWFREQESRDIQNEVFEVSQINMQLNVYKSCVKAAATFHDGFKFEASVPNPALQGALRFAARP